MLVIYSTTLSKQFCNINYAHVLGMLCVIASVCGAIRSKFASPYRAPHYPNPEYYGQNTSLGGCTYLCVTVTISYTEVHKQSVSFSGLMLGIFAQQFLRAKQ